METVCRCLSIYVTEDVLEKILWITDKREEKVFETAPNRIGAVTVISQELSMWCPRATNITTGK